jgi:hypothetical protein
LPPRPSQRRPETKFTCCKLARYCVYRHSEEEMRLLLLSSVIPQLYAFAVRTVHNLEDYRSITGNRAIFFHARGCRACAIALPRFQKLANSELADSFVFVKMNIDGDLDLLQEAQGLGIKTLPRVALLVDDEDTRLMPCTNIQTFEELRIALEAAALK